MFSKILSLACWLSVISLPVWAQQTEPVADKPVTRNLLKINYLSPILNTFGIAYERTLPEKSASVQITLHYMGDSEIYGDFILRGGMALIGEYRLYLSEKKQAPNGFFIAPFLSYNYLDYRSYTYTSSYSGYKGVEGGYNRVGLGLIGGWQWVFKKRVSLDVWGGTGYYYGVVTRGSGFDMGFPFKVGTGASMRIGSTVGFAF
jgi:Protein of unknown function (DUF3575)